MYRFVIGGGVVEDEEEEEDDGVPEMDYFGLQNQFNFSSSLRPPFIGRRRGWQR